MDRLGWQIVLQLLLIALNAIFACAEIAVISMNDAKLAKLAAAGDKRAVRLARLTSQPARFLATIQVAITLSGFLGSAFAADYFSDLLANWLIGLGVTIPEEALNAIALVVITVLLSYLTLVLGELVPKRVAMRKAEKLALGLSGLITFISTVFAPLVWLLTASTNGVLRLLGIDPNQEDEPVTEEEIRMMVDAGTEKGAIDPDEKEIIQNVFEFDDLTAEDVATHRMDVVVLWLEDPVSRWEEIIHDSRHTMFPVCGETADDVKGVLNAKDYFRLKDKSRDKVLGLVKEAYFVPAGVKADVLFQNMKRTRNRFAVVLDDYGGMLGILTLNDLVEQLVGNFADEEDAPEAEPELRKLDDSTWQAVGTVSLDELSESLGVIFPEDEELGDNLNALVFDNLGTVPPDGSTPELTVYGLRIWVKEISEHRIEKALVCKCEEEKPEDEED